MADTQPAAATAAPGLASPREIKIVLPGLLMAILLAMLDQLIVGTALPRIVGELGGVAHLSWVVTAYVLAATVTTPLYGKLGDLYGRKKLFITAIVIFLAGSALSGLAQSMTMLIAFRALQGLGAGGLMVGAIAILGELVSPRERGKYMGYIMAVMMLATIGGPLAGGFITDHFSWRWVFYINLPLGGAALVYLSRVLKLPAHRTEHVIDYLGAALLAVAATAIVLVTTWGGSQYAWGSPEIIGLAVLGVAAVAAFLRTESRAVEPMLPLHLFRIRNFSLVAALSFLVGLAMFGAITFLPLYQQTVQGASATVSGLLLTPMMIGVMVTSIIAGQVTSQDRPLQDPADPRLGRHGRGHVPADPARPGYQPGDLGAVLRRPRPGHGPAHADHLADGAEQRGAEGHRRGQQLADLLPADRRLDRRVGVRRAVRQGADRARCPPPVPARPRACTSPTASSTRPRSACCPRRSSTTCSWPSRTRSTRCSSGRSRP